MKDGELLAGVLSVLMAGDDDASTNRDRLCAFILSVRLLKEKPWATAVRKQNKKNKKTAQCSAVENFVVCLLKCIVCLFFLIFGLPAPNLRWLDFVM